MPRVTHHVYRPPTRTTLKKRRRPRIYATPATPVFSFSLALMICAFLAGLAIFNILKQQTDNQPSGQYSLVGKPSISVQTINTVLRNYDSPAQGKGESLYKYGEQYGIDPAFALAFFMHESNFGTRGVARETHSLGNIRATAGYESYQGYRKYATWEDGFEDWYKLISNLYVEQWQLTTVDQIIPVYAPAADNNDEAQYISSVKYLVDRWRRGYTD